MKRLCLLLAVVLSARVAGAAMPAGEDRRVISLSGAGWTADGESVCVPHTWNAIDGADGLGACTDESANSPSYARRFTVVNCRRILSDVEPSCGLAARLKGPQFV